MLLSYYSAGGSPVKSAFFQPFSGQLACPSAQLSLAKTARNMAVGYVREIWRYPVKSMAGGMLRTSPVSLAGMVGDRNWALRDDTLGDFDAFPIHLLTTASLHAMAGTNPASLWDVRRFRPNFLIDTGDGDTGFVENSWTGRRLRIGEVVMQCEIPTVRCGMTTHVQADLPKDPSVLRAIVRDAGQNLGIYARVITAGAAATRDPVQLL